MSELILLDENGKKLNLLDVINGLSPTKLNAILDILNNNPEVNDSHDFGFPIDYEEDIEEIKELVVNALNNKEVDL